MVSFKTLAVIYGALGALTGVNASPCKASTGNPHGDNLPCLRYVYTTAELQLDARCGDRNLAVPEVGETARRSDPGNTFSSVPATDFNDCVSFCYQAEACDSFSYESNSCMTYQDTIEDLDLERCDNELELLRTLLDPLEPFFSPQKARVKCPGATAVRFDQAASEVEGICRPLWGLSALLAGGGEYHGKEWWIQGIKSGTDPENPEYWGYPKDNDQRMVEMCPLGFAFAVVPDIWSSFSEKERENVETWLGNSINEKKSGITPLALLVNSLTGHSMPNTNWLWFRVFANLGLKKNGGKFSQERLDSDIKHLDTFYRGDGWSNDGPEGIHQMDYYSSSFAIHLLQLLYAKVAGKEDPERAEEFKKRAQLVALDLAHYFDDEGRAIPFGRSVGYRFAMVSFWGVLAYAGVELPEPLTWGMVKGMVLRNLRWWQTQNEMWTSSGTLSIGYSYPNMYMAENYNSPGSPACSYPMKGTHAKYGGFAYSSAYGYSVPPGLFSLEQYALASQLGFSDDGGEYWKTRRLSEYSGLEYRGGKPVLVSIWKPFPDVKVRTTLIPPEEETPNWHLRVHQIESGREVMTADGSFAVKNVSSTSGRYLGQYSEETHEGTYPKIIGNYDVKSPAGWAAGKSGAFAVSAGAVGIKALEPMDGREAMLVNADPNSNLIESRSTIPTLQHTIGAGQSVWYISAIYAKPSAAGVAKESYLDGWEKPPAVPSWLETEMDGTSQ
ncbi:hypothetical protein G7Z17_g9504 [Cylindrodendrum hubeiense]|uniref:Apple domain-containing protein n=1 Tax=Cylindrodendrum hubeiense TaxID=595255 RepID=A0A9P5H4F5_9HYPO|nr:hypothetical protein G7Z17_g9504 [Cylindrodendrum hubeiense]